MLKLRIFFIIRVTVNAHYTLKGRSLDTAHFGQLALLHTRNPHANQILFMFMAESSEMECFAFPA